MASNVSISFDHEDQQQIAGFRLLRHNPHHPLDFQDHSLKEAVRDAYGRPISCPPSDRRSQTVRDEIIRKFDRASRLLVLIGDRTHRSEWVNWEIKTFYEMKAKVSGALTWKRIRGMTLKGSDTATVPSALYNGRSVQWLSWNLEELDRWLDVEP